MTMYTLEKNPEKELFDLIQIEKIHALILEQHKSNKELNEDEFSQKLFNIWDKSNEQNIIFEVTPTYFKNPMIFLIHLAKAFKQFKSDLTFDEILDGIEPFFSSKTLNISTKLNVDITCAKQLLKNNY